MAHLRSEIRMEIKPSKYADAEGPIMYLSGKTLKNDNLLEVGGMPLTLT